MGVKKALVALILGRALLHNVVLAIRNGYQLAEDAYSIVETEQGYDIVIHIKKEK